MEVDRSLPDLASYLNADPLPCFIIPIDLLDLNAFEPLFCNNAFQRDSSLRSLVLGDEKFKNWCRIVNDCRHQYEFADRSWTAFTVNGHFKAIRISPNFAPFTTKATGTQEPAADDHMGEKLKEASVAITKLQSLESMFEISQIGTFEYDPSGVLISANVRYFKRPFSWSSACTVDNEYQEAYYQMSGYPRSGYQKNNYGIPDFSFMDLVYPDDLELAASIWSNLLQGKSDYAEIRVQRPRNSLTKTTSLGDNPSSALSQSFDDDGFLWIFAACAPIMDDAGNVLFICGNTADISVRE